MRPSTQWAWLAGGLALAFAVPFVFADLLSTNRDLYYGIYAAAVFSFFALWLRSTAGNPRAVLIRNWNGDVIWSAPTLLTLSPLGAPIAHIGLHVSAVVHSYDTNTFLPPHAEGSTKGS